MTTCRVSQAPFRGWEACALENEYIRLIAVPDIGGRIMAYDLGLYPFFFVDLDLAGRLFTPEEHQGDGSLAAWKNYGGDKTWPAPQGWERDDQWHGPPDPVLDSGRYHLESLHSDGQQAQMVMRSAPDPRTGVQITRSFTLRSGSSRVNVDLTFHNHTARPIRWSIWDVAQLRAERRGPDGVPAYEPGCVITVPLNPNSVFPRGYTVMFGAPDNPQWQTDPKTGLFQAEYGWQIGKVGLDSPAGWIAFCNRAAHAAFITQFAYQPGQPYPDGGASAEIWTVGAGQVGNLNYEHSGIYLMETEVLSPLMTIEPGGAAHFGLTWVACQSDGAILAVSEGGAASLPLTARRSRDGLHVQFRGGAFDAGPLWLVGRDSAGREATRTALGSADPLTPVAVDQSLPLLAGAQALQLLVGDKPLAFTSVINLSFG